MAGASQWAIWGVIRSSQVRKIGAGQRRPSLENRTRTLTWSRPMYSVLVLAALSPAAPAPKAKPIAPLPRAEVVGLWKLSWGESAWEARFSDDGHYASWGNNVTWIGSWRLDGDVLTVTERILDSSSTSTTGYTWKAKLSRHSLGTL